MGQAQSSSRRGSDSSIEPLNPRNGSLEKAYESFYGADSNPNVHDNSTVTQPEQPRQLHRVSELIDPHELLGLTHHNLTSYPYDRVPVYPYKDKNKRLPQIVESPSGTLLGAHEFIARPNRPLAIRERQENIRQAIEKADMQEKASRALKYSYKERKGSMSKEREGSKGSICSDSSGSSSRKDSTSSKSTVGDFEKSKIEEGRCAYERKQRKKKKKKGAHGSHGCFTRFK